MRKLYGDREIKMQYSMRVRSRETVAWGCSQTDMDVTYERMADCSCYSDTV